MRRVRRSPTTGSTDSSKRQEREIPVDPPTNVGKRRGKEITHRPTQLTREHDVVCGEVPPLKRHARGRRCCLKRADMRSRLPLENLSRIEQEKRGALCRHSKERGHHSSEKVKVGTIT